MFDNWANEGCRTIENKGQQIRKTREYRCFYGELVKARSRKVKGGVLRCRDKIEIRAYTGSNR
jgi:hypothetical protein